MNLYEILMDERDFKIMICGETFFHEPLFPILELVKYIIDWSKKKENNFVYNTMESEDNPLIMFQKNESEWIVHSPWQRFECKRKFTLSEVNFFVQDIVNQVIIF